MKKSLRLITMLIVMMACVNATKAQQTSFKEGITYALVNNTTAKVIKCDTTVVHAKVLSSVNINGFDYPVTAIGNAAFGVSRWDYSYSNRNLKSVELPSGIRTIEDCAFHRCTALESIELPGSLTTIGEYAFAETGILTMELPATITTIGYNAFPSSMSKLTCNAITPPTLLSSTDGSSMGHLGNISIIYVPLGSKAAYKVDPWAAEVILDGSETPVNVTVSPGMLGEEILNQVGYLSDVNYLTVSGSINETDINNIKNSMPNLLTVDMSGLDMKTIPSELFYNRKALLSIILPKNVETIEDKSFYGCINLESIVLPEGLKSINGYYSDWDSYNHGAFRGCTSLKSISFPSTLETIGNYTFNGCTALKEVAFKSGLKAIGSEAFSGCTRLYKIEFTEGLTSIGNRAFYGCGSLVSLTFPKSLTGLSSGAFYGCSSLEHVTFAEGIQTIGYEYEEENPSSYTDGAFQNCRSLKQITFANGLEKICQNSFSGCSSLTEVTIPEGVTFIGRNAFSRCSKLTSVNLPSTLVSCSTTPFAGCNKLSNVKCEALLPPTLADGLLTLDDMGLALKRTLSVPEWTLNRYKLTSGWAAFAEILPLSGIYPSSINVTGEAVLTLPTAGLPANYKPDMQIMPSYSPNGTMMAYGLPSSLHLRGTGTLPLSTFTIDAGYDASNGQLQTEATMTADKVVAEMHLSGTYYDNISYVSRQKWHFLSFPFDVKISEITTNSDWVVRKYDGKARANGDYNNTWITVPYDSILHAGQGYIWACTDGSFTLPAVDNANKNLIFANGTRNIPLQEYTSEYISNNSWNLVGNPFPCYYDIQEMDYTAPITVWDCNNNTYAAYSPIDDKYVLAPFEAFFVQRPTGVTSISFKPEGRQLIGIQSPSTPKPAPSRTRSKDVKRQVINLTLNGNQGGDRTRIVINDAAKMDYELSCDAAKFMSNDASIPQLYSMSNEERFAINERPMGNGIVKLGTYFGMAGTYTISMQSESDVVVMLIDHKTGVETDLIMSDYTFNAETGETNRFEVRLYADEDVTAIESVTTNTKVTTADNAIIVTASTDADVKLYTTAGSLIATGKGQNLTFEAAQGIYVVKVNGVSHKVTVVK